MKQEVIIISGSNLGDRELHLQEAVQRCEQQIGPLVEISSLFESAPWGFASSGQFLNQVFILETMLSPWEVLNRLLEIEALAGRLRNGGGYASRTLDLDILFYGDQVIHEDGLQIPHPRMTERRFVLAPLAEIRPWLLHPVSGESIRSLLEKCSDNSEVVPVRKL